MRRLLLTLLISVAVCSMTFADTQAWVDGIRYSFSTRPYGTTGKYQCCTYKPVDSGFASGEEYSGEIIIPEEVVYEGTTYVVTELGYQSFADQANVTSVIAPATVEKISTQALYGTSITSFIIPEKVQSIDLYPFMRCGNLTELVSLNPQPPTTHTSAFQGVDQSKVTLYVPKGCVDAYRNATRWSGFSTIEEYADTPVRPTEISITNHPNVVTVGKTGQLTYTILPADATDKTVTWKSFDTSVVTVSETGILTAVGPGRTYVEAICNGDTRISSNIFINVIAQESVVNGLRYRFELDEEKQIANAYVVNDASYAGNIIIPERVQNATTFIVRGLDPNAFALNSNVTSVTLPATIETIGESAFEGTGIDVIAIPQKVRHISRQCFANCASLVSVALPDGLQSVGAKAFYGSTKIRYIYSYNFGGDDLVLPTFDTFDGDPTNYGEAFSTDIWPDCMLVIPAGMYGNYKKCAGWKNFRSFFYWHDTDVMPTSVDLTPADINGTVGDVVTLKPTVSPADATNPGYIIIGAVDNNLISIEPSRDADNTPIYNITLKKAGQTSLKIYCGLNKAICNINIEESSGIDNITGDDSGVAPRYFTPQGVEIQNPTKGQPVIEVRGTKATKRVIQ